MGKVSKETVLPGAVSSKGTGFKNLSPVGASLAYTLDDMASTGAKASSCGCQVAIFLCRLDSHTV